LGPDRAHPQPLFPGRRRRRTAVHAVAGPRRGQLLGVRCRADRRSQP
jgi:hypothetical protein